MLNNQGNHIYADDDSELDNVCEVCGEFLDRHHRCQNCKDSSKEEKFEEKYYKEKWK